MPEASEAKMAASIAPVSSERPINGHDKRTSKAYVRSPHALALTAPSSHHLDNDPALSAPRSEVRDERWGSALSAFVVHKMVPSFESFSLTTIASSQLRAYSGTISLTVFPAVSISRFRLPGIGRRR